MVYDRGLYVDLGFDAIEGFKRNVSLVHASLCSRIDTLNGFVKPGHLNSFGAKQL